MDSYVKKNILRKGFFTIVAALLFMVFLMQMQTMNVWAYLQHDIQLSVEYKENIVFAKYDVQVYWDDIYVGTMSQGDKLDTVLYDVADGCHILKFCKMGEQTVKGIMEIITDADSQISCSIVSRLGSITINDLEIYGMEGAAINEYQTSQVNLCFNYKDNILLAKYNVELYIDGEYTNTLMQGNQYKMTVGLSNGIHTFTLYSASDKNVKGEFQLIIPGNTDYECDLKAHMAYIEISNINTNAYNVIDEAAKEPEREVPTSRYEPVRTDNGEIIVYPKGIRVAPLTIITDEAAKGKIYYIYLENINDASDAMGFIVHGGSFCDMDVPLGTYYMYYGYGPEWYGKTDKFGDNGQYYKCEGTFHFYEDRLYVHGHTITLSKTENGNLDIDEVNSNAFPG